MYSRDIFILVFTYIITYFITTLIKSNGIVNFILKILIVCFVPNFIFFILLYRTKQFKKVKERFSSIIKSILNKKQINKME